MRRGFIFDFRQVLSIVFERLSQPIHGILHVAFPVRFTNVQPKRGQGQGLGGRLAQSFNLDAIDVEILADHIIQAHAAGHVGKLSAQVRILACPKELSKACALGFHRKRLAGLDRQIGEDSVPISRRTR